MYFRTILSGTLAVLLLSGAAIARDSAPTNDMPAARPGLSVPAPTAGLPGVFGSTSEAAPVRMAQAGDPRVTQLEEQIRSLNGTIEELNFQILQMQEQMRKMQEDNEFRFQELEKRSDAKGGKTNRSVAENSASPSNSKTAAPAVESPTASTSQGVEKIIEQDSAVATQPGGAGEPPRSFGTITFDANGNVVGGAPGNATASPDAEGSKVAALPTSDDPDELYRNAYQFILSGDYGTAEAGFRDHIARFPKDAKAADAHFWLGESLLGQQKYRDAAEVFLAANKDYPKSKKAPEMLLKLGVSLVGLNQRDVACATFNEVGKRYPNVSGALKERVKQEKALAAC